MFACVVALALEGKLIQSVVDSGVNFIDERPKCISCADDYAAKIHIRIVHVLFVL